MPPQRSAAVWWAPLTQDQKELVLKEAADFAAQLYRVYTEALYESAGLRPLKGEKLMQEFRNRTPEAWDRLFQINLGEYDLQQKQWLRLENDYIRKQRGRTNPPPMTQTPEAKTGQYVPLPREGM